MNKSQITHTFQEMLNNSKQIKQSIDQEIYPEGTTKQDWMIIGEYAVYTPYIKLYHSTNDYTPQASSGTRF